MCAFPILTSVPSLLALSFGTWAGPVLGIPALALVVLFLTFWATPSDTQLRTKAVSWDIPAPAWSKGVRGLAIGLHISAVIWASYIGLSA